MSLHSLPLQPASPHFFEGNLAQTEGDRSERHLLKTSSLLDLDQFNSYGRKWDGGTLQALPALLPYMRSDGVFGAAAHSVTHLSVIPAIGPH